MISELFKLSLKETEGWLPQLELLNNKTIKKMDQSADLESSGDELEALLLAELEQAQAEETAATAQEDPLPPSSKRQKTGGELNFCFSLIGIIINKILLTYLLSVALQKCEVLRVLLTQDLWAAFAFDVVLINQPLRFST